MKKLPNRQLLVNYLLGLSTSKEESEVEEWLADEPENSALLQELAEEVEEHRTFTRAEKNGLKDDLFRQLRFADKSDPTKIKLVDRPIHSSGRKVKVMGWGLKIAATILLLITVIGISFYYQDYFQPTEKEAEVIFKERTLTAGQKATLRFGEGSVITLNSESTLRYPTRFSADKREVYLDGEAYFSVEHDSTRPFIVHVGETTIRDLGTAFNIRAYNEEDELQIAVTEGKVAVTNEEDLKETDREPVYLTENQWLTYRPAKQLIEISEGDLWEMVAWKDDVLVFKDQSLSCIAKRLERWYNIDIDLADSSLANRHMSATFEDNSLGQVLKIIALSLDISYRKDAETVKFYKEK